MARNTRANKYQQLLEERAKLPVYNYKEQFLKLLDENQCLILSGETGSGKTTQVPQWCLSYLQGAAGDGPIKKVACTQPRRISAINVARRVAEEINVEVGNQVGYSIRFENCTSEHTVLTYMTDGMLLREIMASKNLENYGIILLDEAHERSLATDILLGFLKDILRTRDDLKLIVMSATLNYEQFEKYLECPSLRIPGRLYPVEVLHADSPVEDYLHSAIATAVHIHFDQPKGDILVFLTGEDEIEKACEAIDANVRRTLGKTDILTCIPLYSNLTMNEQKRIFEASPGRKCIVATNIAETSITIPNIVYVVDSGFCKRRVFSPDTCIDFFNVAPISRASAEQRAGRAGRTQPGKCYRLYTNDTYENFLEEHTPPEILTCNLATLVLMLKKLGVEDLIRFDYLSPPTPQSIARALELGYYLGAIDDHGNLTELGSLIVEFPLVPPLAKMLIASAQKYGCSNEILTLVSLLSTQNCLIRPVGQKTNADQRHTQFVHKDGDHLTLLNVFNAFIANGSNPQWCNDNFISFRSLKQASSIKRQLAGIMRRFQLPHLTLLPSSPNYSETIRKCILNGHFMQIGNLGPSGWYMSVNEDFSKVSIHSTSSLSKHMPEWVVFNELVFTHKTFMRTVSRIDPEWLFECAPHYYDLSLLPNNVVTQRLANVWNGIVAKKEKKRRK